MNAFNSVMKNLILSSMLFCFAVEALAEIPHNSRRFIISDYYYPDGKGGYASYKAHGFAQQPTAGSKTRIFLLPLVEKNTNDIKFYDEDGVLFDPKNNPNKLARSISIPLSAIQKLPSKFHIPAIVSALTQGLDIDHFMYPIAKDQNGNLLVYPPAQAMLFQLNQNNQQYERRLEEQNNLVAQFDSYLAELVNLTELEIEVKIGQDTLAHQVYSGSFLTMSSNLPSIEITRPTMFHQNKLRQGDASIFVSYKFRDAKTKSISARFDAKAIIDNFLSETQQSRVSSNSSGWQVLGFGSRRTSIKTEFNQSVKEEYKGEKMESSVIEMYDADDDMIAQFEADFFPELSQEKVIENHLQAAKEAEAKGAEKLRDLHLQYAKAIKGSEPDLEVNIEGAVASLSAGDYAGFVAKGVRWGDHRATGNSEFRRVVHQQAEIERVKRWSQARTISVQHALTMPAIEAVSKSQLPFLGMCGAVAYTYPVPTQNTWGQWFPRPTNGMMFTCATEGGPLIKAGVMPGMIVAKINGTVVTTTKGLEDVLESLSPGDNVTVTIAEYQGDIPTMKRISVTLAAGKPRQ